MKKICFIIYGNLYLAPYIQNYLNVFNTEQCDIICWDRHDLSESYDKCRVLALHYPVKDNESSKFDKLIGYLKYTSFVRKQLRQEKYDLVVCLQSIAAICNVGTLLRKYTGKYIVDIRDYSIEGNRLLRAVEKKLLQRSCLNVISSEGYKNFLPKNCNYQIVHNYSGIDKDICTEFKSKELHKPISLSYIGLIRFQEQNKRIIDLFANDARFQVNFIGKNAYELQDHITENDIKNVRLIDQFPPEKTIDYYRETDAILNVYGNHTKLLDYALSNKLYYAASLEMPILVSEDTYMEEISQQYQFGFTLNFDDKSITDKLYQYMLHYDRKEFSEGCARFMEKVNKENSTFTQSLRNLLEETRIK